MPEALPELKWEVAALPGRTLHAEHAQLPIVTPALKQIPAITIHTADRAWPGLQPYKREAIQPIAMVAAVSLLLRLPGFAQPQ